MDEVVARLVLSGIVKPLQALGQFLGPNQRSLNGFHSAISIDDPDYSAADTTASINPASPTTPQPKS
ncbi:hypothetical protein ACFXTH_037770 [Malus domestica]